jgi:hypothetical protein
MPVVSLATEDVPASMAAMVRELVPVRVRRAETGEA